MTDDEERNLALEALQQIARHEAECGERWGECVAELKHLRASTDAQGQRWEKLAWLVITTMLTGAVAVTSAVIF
tara:strand:- start:3540 stop:3761 length:222 start_codon:yes stop_codon:yes gene_type:complete